MGGVLLTAVVGAVIFVVFAHRMRSVHMRIFVVDCYWSCFSQCRAKVDKHDSLCGAAKEQKGHILTSSNVAYGPVQSNLAYGQVKGGEGAGSTEYEMSDMPSGAAVATQEATYDTIPS